METNSNLLNKLKECYYIVDELRTDLVPYANEIISKVVEYDKELRKEVGWEPRTCGDDYAANFGETTHSFELDDTGRGLELKVENWFRGDRDNCWYIPIPSEGTIGCILAAWRDKQLPKYKEYKARECRQIEAEKA